MLLLPLCAIAVAAHAVLDVFYVAVVAVAVVAVAVVAVAVVAVAVVAVYSVRAICSCSFSSSKPTASLNDTTTLFLKKVILLLFSSDHRRSRRGGGGPRPRPGRRRRRVRQLRFGRPYLQPRHREEAPHEVRPPPGLERHPPGGIALLRGRQGQGQGSQEGADQVRQLISWSPTESALSGSGRSGHRRRPPETVLARAAPCDIASYLLLFISPVPSSEKSSNYTQTRQQQKNTLL